jgi:hypothetical protein
MNTKQWWDDYYRGKSEHILSDICSNASSFISNDIRRPELHSRLAAMSQSLNRLSYGTFGLVANFST